MSQSKPNVLIIQTDQQSLWTLGCYGGNLVQTPNIDRIAAEGAIFRNLFTCSAVCTPSRGSFLTGRYPHCHGAHTNNIALNRDEITLGHVFQNQGYETGYIGKWHLNGPEGLVGNEHWIPPSRSMGFDDCRWMAEDGHYKWIVEPGQNSRAERFELSEKKSGSRYMTDWLADKTIDYIQQHKSENFFLMVSIPDPHTPYEVCEPYASMFEPEDMSIPETFCQEEIPSWIKLWHEKYAKCFGPGFGLDDPNRQEALKWAKAAYCGMVKCIDDNVGRILNYLEQQKILEDTLVIFTSDHGEYMGEHTIYGKNCIYETAYHIPLVMRCPKLIEAGTTLEQFFNIVDFYPTLLGLMGLEQNGRVQGRDGSAILRNEQQEWTNECFFERLDPGEPVMVGVITPQFQLAFSSNGQSVLYDRQKDPLQLQNVASNKYYQEDVKQLREKTVRHFSSIGSPAFEWVSQVHRGDMITEENE